MNEPIITICSSAAFYRQAVEIQDQLSKLGVEVIVPTTATRMKESGDFDVSHYKTWFADAMIIIRKHSLCVPTLRKLKRAMRFWS